MSQRPVRPVLVLLASTSLLSLGGCATTADGGGIDMRSVHDRIESARQQSIALGGQAWDGARRVLGIGDHAADAGLDEVDLAMREKDAVLPPSLTQLAQRDRWAESRNAAGDTRDDNAAAESSDAETRQVQVSAVPRPVVSDGMLFSGPAMDDKPAAAQGSPDVLADDVLADNAAEAIVDDSPAQRTADATPAGADDLSDIDVSQAAVVPERQTADESPADLTYTVKAGETLWTIAKATTGDAIDWHQIADVNDLGPGAVVKQGQTLRIPGALLRTDEPATENASLADAGSATNDLDADTEAPAIAAASAGDRRDTDSNEGNSIAGADKADDADVDSNAGDVIGDELADVTLPDRDFRISEGETLWDFSRRVTGDATLWAAIAAHNRFDQRKASTVRAGQTIRVPLDLIDGNAPAEPRQAGNADAAGVDEPITPPASAARTESSEESASAAPANEAAEATTATRSTSADGEASEPDRIVEARYRDEARSDATIMVRGTYYPKAVYRNADFSSSLLMRVSPGTALKVAGSEGPWYQVETTKGTGYMHSRDIK